MESKSVPPSFDIARRYVKHREQDYLRYGEWGKWLMTEITLKENKHDK
jgi:hypothetical protein